MDEDDGKAPRAAVVDVKLALGTVQEDLLASVLGSGLGHGFLSTAAG